jgi:hypothetical protein
MTTSEAVLHVTGYMEPEYQKKYLMAKALKPKNYFIYLPQRHVETMTLQASSTYTVRLSGLMGHANQILWVLRSATNGAALNNQFAFYKPESYEILDSAGMSLTGFSPITKQDMTLLYSHQHENQFITNTNAMVHSFSQTPVMDIVLGGQINGMVHFDSFHQIRFTTSSSLSTASYILYVVALYSESLVINNSMLSVTHA